MKLNEIFEEFRGFNVKLWQKLLGLRRNPVFLWNLTKHLMILEVFLWKFWWIKMKFRLLMKLNETFQWNLTKLLKNSKVFGETLKKTSMGLDKIQHFCETARNFWRVLRFSFATLTKTFMDKDEIPSFYET